jgi:hypothetical protein
MALIAIRSTAWKKEYPTWLSTEDTQTERRASKSSYLETHPRRRKKLILHMLLNQDEFAAKKWLLDRAFGKRSSVSKNEELAASKVTAEPEDEPRRHVSLRGGFLRSENIPSFVDDSASQATFIIEPTTSSLPSYNSGEGPPPPYPAAGPDFPRTISRILHRRPLPAGQGIEFLVRWRERKNLPLKLSHSDANFGMLQNGSM